MVIIISEGPDNHILASTLICSAKSFQLRLSKSRPPAYTHRYNTLHCFHTKETNGSCNYLL